MSHDAFRQTAEDADGSYPESVVLQPDEFIIGVITNYSQAATAWGARDIAWIDDEDRGGVRSLWLTDTVLRQNWADLSPQVGERVFVKRHPDKCNAAGLTYHPFTASVEGRTTALPSNQMEDANTAPSLVVNNATTERGRPFTEGEIYERSEEHDQGSLALQEDTTYQTKDEREGGGDGVPV